MAKKEKPLKVEKRNAAQKKQMYLQRAANTFGANITGRGAEVAKDTQGLKYLTKAERAEYKPKPKPKKK
jgi:hypothetical protein